LRPAALFDALRREPEELALVLAPDVEKNLDTLHQVVDPWIRGRLLGALATTVEGPEVLELGLEGKSDVSIHFSWSLFGARSWR
jgi:hypothetical protein